MQAFPVKSGNGSEERVTLAESEGWGVSRCVEMEEGREMSARMEGGKMQPKTLYHKMILIIAIINQNKMGIHFAKEVS